MTLLLEWCGVRALFLCVRKLNHTQKINMRNYLRIYVILIGNIANIAGVFYVNQSGPLFPAVYMILTFLMTANSIARNIASIIGWDTIRRRGNHIDNNVSVHNIYIKFEKYVERSDLGYILMAFFFCTNFKIINHFKIIKKKNILFFILV